MKKVLLVLVSAIVATRASAILIDLTTVTEGEANGAIFTAADLHGEGTGNLDPFVRLHDNEGDKNDIDTGYNSSSSELMPDVKSGPWTHDVMLSEIPVVTIGEEDYYEFLLDINQTGQDKTLSIDVLRFFTTPTAVDPADDYTDLTSVGTLRYDMDVGSDGNSKVYAAGIGSGIADMFAYIPTSAFVGASGSHYLYLYTEMGATGGDYKANDGYEEWGVRTGGTYVPDAGSTASLLGVALLAMAAFRRSVNL